MSHILRCPDCRTYTLNDSCPKCSAKTINVKPAKFSPEDKFAVYRRKSKEGQLKEKGVL